MFDLLKKKITGLVGNITKSIVGEREKREEEKTEIEKESIAPKIEQKQIETKETISKASEEVKHVTPIIEQKTIKSEKIEEKLKTEKVELKVELPEKRTEHEIIIEKPKLVVKEEIQERKEVEIKVKPSLLTKVKSFIVPEVTIKEEDISSAIEDFELQLLTADVALPVAEEIISELKQKLIGKTVKSSEIEKYIRDSLYQSVSDVIKQDKIDLIKEIESSNKPYKILFIGPNGAGKTTTIAKVAHYLKKNGKSCVISASDTFRAAAIEQTIEHAKKLDVPFIKHDYGSDPAAVAFDSVKYAEAKKIDVVLIDSAGRQETNRNLIEQLKKIERITSPNLKVFVGEGITGNALLNQISEFNNAIKLNGVILTKLDVDAKGGTVISVKKATGVPLLFIGVGQEYDDLIPFDESYIINRIMSN